MDFLFVCVCFNGVISCHHEDDDECSVSLMVINAFIDYFIDPESSYHVVTQIMNQETRLHSVFNVF